MVVIIMTLFFPFVYDNLFVDWIFDICGLSRIDTTHAQITYQTLIHFPKYFILFK